jgi:hypothetical protein
MSAVKKGIDLVGIAFNPSKAAPAVKKVRPQQQVPDGPDHGKMGAPKKVNEGKSMSIYVGSRELEALNVLMAATRSKQTPKGRRVNQSLCIRAAILYVANEVQAGNAKIAEGFLDQVVIGLTKSEK